MYKLKDSKTVIRLYDNAYIPVAEGNSDYCQYLQWLAEGNTPDMSGIDNPNEVAAYTQAVQLNLDNAARSFGYDDIKSAVTYAEEPSVPKFQNEGKSFRAWRSLCWEYCYEQLDKVQNNERAVPTVEELVAELPEFVLLQG